MRVTTFVVYGVLALAVAPAALAADLPGIPDSLPVVPRNDLRLRVPASVETSAILVGGTGPAQGGPPCGPCRLGYDECGRARWSGNLWLGGWLWGQTGTVGVAGREGDVDTTPADALDLFKDHGESVLTGGGRLGYGRAFAQAWLSYVRLEGEKDALVTGERVEASFDGVTIEAVGGYRVTEVALGCSPCSPCLAIEPYAGVRFNSVDVSIDGPNTSAGDRNDWWDPIVGCAFQFDFRNKWYSSVAASIGGFGVASDLTWSVRADVGYMFTRHFGAFTGMQAIAWDYEDGDFKYDLTQWGPYIGLIVVF